MENETNISSFENYVKKHHLFVLTLALCPSLAVTTTFEGAYVLGFIVFITTILASIIIHLLHKFIDKKLRLYVCLLVNAVIVTIWEVLFNNYVHDMYIFLGAYLSIVVVNFMIVHRAVHFAPSHKLSKVFIDAVKHGFFFMLLLSLIGLLREFLGSNTVTIMDKISSFTGYTAKYDILPANDLIPNPLFLTSAGAFLLLGIILSIIYYVKNRRVQK